MTANRRTFVLKVWLLTFVTIMMSTIVLSIGWSIIKEVIIQSSKQEISAILQFSVTQSAIYVEKVKSYELSRPEAEKQFAQLLSSMHYQTSYVWANDSHGIAQVHIRSDIVGKYQKSYIRHRHLIDNSADSNIAFEVQSNLKPLTNKYTLKINGVALIPEWDWIVGYGLYYDDINQGVWSYFKSLLAVVGV